MAVDVRNVDVESFKESISVIDSITDSIETYKAALKDKRNELAEELGVEKKEIVGIIKMYKKLEAGEGPIDEDLINSIEELYSKVVGD